MGEILLPACQFPRLSDGATCRDIQPQALCRACTAHVQVAALRTRLESVEQERDRLRKVLRDLLPFADEKSNAYAWAMATLDAGALGAAGEKESTDG